MQLMSRRRSDEKKPVPESQKKPVADTEKKPRAGVAIQAFIDPEVRAALDEYIESYNQKHDHKAGVTSTVEAALKKYLHDQGFWPRKSG